MAYGTTGTTNLTYSVDSVNGTLKDGSEYTIIGKDPAGKNHARGFIFHTAPSAGPQLSIVDVEFGPKKGLKFDNLDKNDDSDKIMGRVNLLSVEVAAAGEQSSASVEFVVNGSTRQVREAIGLANGCKINEINKRHVSDGMTDGKENTPFTVVKLNSPLEITGSIDIEQYSADSGEQQSLVRLNGSIKPENVKISVEHEFVNGSQPNLYEITC